MQWERNGTRGSRKSERKTSDRQSPPGSQEFVDAPSGDQNVSAILNNLDSPDGSPDGVRSNGYLESRSPLSSRSGSPLESPSGSPLESPSGSPLESPLGSHTGSLPGSPLGSRPGSPLGSRPGSPSDSRSSSPLGSPPDSPLGSFSRSKSPPPRFGQSIILNQIPRYVRLTVDQPQKLTDGSMSYISYLVTSQQYPEEKPERVRRRFSDFAKLFDRLSVEFAACAIPPLPDRWRLEYIAGDRFSSEFTAKRAASLERFLFRVSQHPSLRRSKAFVHFLSSKNLHDSSNGKTSTSSQPSTTAATATAAHALANGSLTSQDSAAVAALDHISEALMNAFAKARHQSKEMIDARERADRYEQNVATIDKAVFRTSKTQSDLALDFEDLHQHAVKLAKLEPESAPEFQRLALTAQSLMSAQLQLRQGIDSHFGCALRDMSHYVLALKGMLKQREQRQIDYEALVEYLKRSEHELVAAEHGQNAPAFSSSFLRSKLNELRGVDKEHTRQQRISKLKARIAEFKEESAKAKKVSDDYEELAKREVRVFDQTEAIELQQSLAGLSDSYIDFFQTVVRDCKELEASLDPAV